MFSARTASWSSVRAVSMMTGKSRVVALRRIWRQTSMPDITGSIQSSSTRSGCASAIFVKASCPSAASSTRNPCFSRLYRSMVARAASSSTTRTRGFGRLENASRVAVSRMVTLIISFLLTNDGVGGCVAFWPCVRQRLTNHGVIQRLGNVGRMVADAFKVLGNEQQVRAGRDVTRVFHHVGDELTEQCVVDVVDDLVGAPDLDCLVWVVVTERVDDRLELVLHQLRHVANASQR